VAVWRYESSLRAAVHRPHDRGTAGAVRHRRGSGGSGGGRPVGHRLTPTRSPTSASAPATAGSTLPAAGSQHRRQRRGERHAVGAG
jgi:hypothetical protein